MVRTARMQSDFNITGEIGGVKYQYIKIPWVEHLEIYKYYHDSQSAERINERGGFGVREAAYMGYNPLLIWVSYDYNVKDSEWTKIALKFYPEEHTYSYRILTEEEYKSLNIFEKIKDTYDV